MKICSKCKRTLPLDSFAKNSQQKSGLHPSCRECKRSYYQANKEHLNAKAREWHKKNPERSRELVRRWVDKNREAYNAYHVRYRNENREALREKDRQRARQPTRTTQKAAWHAANRERSRALYAEWQKRNRSKVVSYSANRRAKCRTNGGGFTGEEWDHMKAVYEYRCLRCGKQEPEIKLTADHVVPVSKGGHGGIENIQPLCGPCNTWKKDRAYDYRQR